MTDEVGWAELGVRPDVDGFGTSLDRHLGPQLDRSGKAAGKRFGNVMKGTATAAAAGFLAGGYAAISLGKASYEEAKDAQKVGALTAQVIKSTGQAANISAKQVGNLSTNLMKKNAIDDEAIQTGANLLLTFKNIRNEQGKNNDIFNQATAASLDLAASGFGSIESQAKTMGKALNDPIKGITALGRAGVTFSEEQKATIKTMVENGNILGAQKIILREVNSQVGGAAAAQADAGDKIAVAWGNVKETLGEEIVIPLVDYLAKEGVPKLEQFSGWVVKDGVPALKDFANKAEPLAKEILPAIGTTVGTIGDGLKFAAPYAKDLVGAFNDMPDWAKAAFVAGGVGAFAVGKLKPGKSGGLLGAISEAKPLPVFVTNPSFGGLGGPGGPGKPKIPPIAPWLGRLSPLLLPLLTSGDSAPKKPLKERFKDGEISSEAAGTEFLRGAVDVGSVFDYDTVADYESAFKREIRSASDTQVKKWAKGLKELGTSFWKLENSSNEDLDYLNNWMLERTLKRKSLRKMFMTPGEKPGETLLGPSAPTTSLNPMFAATLSNKQVEYIDSLPKKAQIQISTPGLIDSRKDVIDLTQRVDGLGRKDIKPLVKLLGIETAESSVDRLAKKIDNLNAAQFATNNINNAIDAAQERLRAAGINVNVQNMHVADGRDMVKQADRKRRRAQLDGVRSW